MATKAVIRSNKGLRAKYRNALKIELGNASELLGSDVSEVDLCELTSKVSKCIDFLGLYSAKLDKQRDKLLEMIDESEEEFIEEVLNDDFDLSETVEKVCIDLKYFKDDLRTAGKTESKPSEVFTDEKMFEIQNQMKEFMLNQQAQQKEFIEKQIKRDTDKTSVKLPKLDLVSFGGNKIKWLEFWDSFECTVHSNKRLSDIEKFTYLQSKLFGEAKSAISGLPLTNANYHVALSLLKERFGNAHEVVDLHYSKLVNLTPPMNKTSSLRVFLDQVEKHLRSLEVLGKDVQQEVFVSIIKSKLPKEVLLQLEIQKGTTKEWTLIFLRERINQYIVARERTDQDDKRSTQHDKAPPINRYRQNTNDIDDKTLYKTKFSSESSSGYRKSSSEMLLAQDRKAEVKYSARQCRYCEQMHWSDECPNYRTIEERKQRIKGSCFKCLRNNHVAKDCKRNIIVFTLEKKTAATGVFVLGQ
ncbi:uncharacterized protein LOC123566652 [Mercenaria mercenaria]|uniref:uncharacterized protein LOC123566652 n=1 Tax=Mercenaria mercenaria TaxID=6596 RepID=UPI00234E734F|nr:uncharacterized protein LOC123566652 [Mercenaria mercenaria]